MEICTVKTLINYFYENVFDNNNYKYTLICNINIYNMHTISYILNMNEVLYHE